MRTKGLIMLLMSCVAAVAISFFRPQWAMWALFLNGLTPPVVLLARGAPAEFLTQSRGGAAVIVTICTGTPSLFRRCLC